jgi:hypothetical protein
MQGCKRRIFTASLAHWFSQQATVPGFSTANQYVGFAPPTSNGWELVFHFGVNRWTAGVQVHRKAFFQRLTGD